jgi:hypothetical protein
MMLSEVRERAWRGLLDFAWRQWAQAGVSANIAGLDRWAIDPEALILFTISVARRDPRLFDETLDWLAANRHLLSMQRLRNLSRRFPIDARLVGAVSAWAGDSVPPQALKGHDLPSEQVPVFSRDVLSFIGEPDPVFAEYGYIRPRVVRSGKSREPDVKMPANFAFQLRYLFGPGSRSEVVRILLTFTDGPLDAARISDEAAFAKRNINDTLASLVASNAVKARWSRNERNFIIYRNKWATLLEVGPSAGFLPEFVSWVHLLPASLEIIDWLDRIVVTEDSEYLISSRARDLMERIAPDLETAGLDVLPRFTSHGVSYLPVFVDAVDSLLASMGATYQG